MSNRLLDGIPELGRLSGTLVSTGGLMLMIPLASDVESDDTGPGVVDVTTLLDVTVGKIGSEVVVTWVLDDVTVGKIGSEVVVTWVLDDVTVGKIGSEVVVTWVLDDVTVEDRLVATTKTPEVTTTMSESVGSPTLRVLLTATSLLKSSTWGRQERKWTRQSLSSLHCKSVCSHW